MSNVYDLARLRADMDREFAPLRLDVDGETLTLRNVLRIDDKDRKPVLDALSTVQAAFSNEEGEGVSPEAIDAAAEAIETILRAVTADGKGEKLVRHLNGDLALSLKVINLWAEASQPGEASGSPN